MKICSICQQLKNEEDFSFRNQKFNVRHKHCKNCQSIAREKSYKKKKDYYLKYAKDHYPDQKAKRKETRDFIIEFKSNKPCVDCKEIYPHYVMDFDHLPQYKKQIKIASHGNLYTKEKLLEEFAKCEIVCANCHRERTWKRKVGG